MCAKNQNQILDQEKPDYSNCIYYANEENVPECILHYAASTRQGKEHRSMQHPEDQPVGNPDEIIGTGFCMFIYHSNL